MVRAYADSTDQAVGRVTHAISFMLIALVLERARTKEGEPLFLVKGGVSMELRLRLKARATKDLDTVFRGRFEEWLDALDDALSASVEGFSVSRTEPVEIRETHTFRVNVAIDLKGRRWGQVVLEVAPAEAASVRDVSWHIAAFPRPAEAIGMLVDESSGSLLPRKPLALTEAGRAALTAALRARTLAPAHSIRP